MNFALYHSLVLLLVLMLFAQCKTPSESTDPTLKSNLPLEEDRLYFHDPAPGSAPVTCEGRILPLKFRLMATDYAELRRKLLSVPIPAKGAAPDTLLLAVPDTLGALSVFRIFHSSVMPPELAARYPEIRAFSGVGLDSPGDQIRLEINPLGFSAMITSVNGTTFIDPYCKNDSVHVIVYRKSDLPPGAKQPFEK